MKLGLSGTRNGATEAQKIVAAAVISAWSVEAKAEIEFHHGCCEGADEDLHKIVRLLFNNTVQIIGHPSHNKTWESYICMKDCDGFFDPKEYLERDLELAQVCDRLIATPKQYLEVIRSGTWATARYFRKINKPVVIVKPDGNLLRFNPA